MYDARTLKAQLSFDDHTVECPVVGCTQRLPRQRKVFRRDERFRCPDHDIFVSASTHDHAERADNLLSPGAEDLALLDRLVREKRETGRLGRERSEDALTFNVFRALGRANALDAVLSESLGRHVMGAVASYWSLDSETGKPAAMLAEARIAFGEVPDRGTEPDVLIETDDTVMLVEAKLGAKNETTPTHARSLDTYETAAGEWYTQVFASCAAVVALEHRFYQLMRLWLLGSWMAQRVGKRFVLISLCGEAGTGALEAQFGAHIFTSDQNRFVRVTWETIRRFAERRVDNVEMAQLASYLEHKTMGYDGAGRLQLAFPTSLRATQRAALRSQRNERHPFYGVTASEGLHVARNKWRQRTFLGQHCDALIASLPEAIAATAAIAPSRWQRGLPYKIHAPNNGARIALDAMGTSSKERQMERRIYDTYAPDRGETSNVLWHQLVALQVPLAAQQQSDGWGRIDLLALTASGEPIVVELKTDESTETPLRAILEGMANAVVVRENWAALSKEIRESLRSHGNPAPVADAVSTVRTLVLAPESYWENWAAGGVHAAREVTDAGRGAVRALRAAAARHDFPVALGTFDWPSEQIVMREATVEW